MALPTTAEPFELQAILVEHLGNDVGEVLPLSGGFFSRAFAVTAGGRQYVVRLSSAAHAAEGFAKDEYASRHFAAPYLPIPRGVARGRADGLQFAINARIPGRTLAECTAEDRRAALPAVLDTLDALARTDVSRSHGYGHWRGDGNGGYTSWHAFLIGALDDATDGYYAGWHSMFEEGVLERDVYDAVYRYMLSLLPYCPETRALVHNDFQFENILVEDAHITGVIDWANALYGDPLYDVARLAIWSTQPGWWYDDGAALLHARYGALPRYEQRIACYRCHIGLDDLRFYARTGNRPQYKTFREQLLALVTNGTQ